jgi:hypothetical protein
VDAGPGGPASSPRRPQPGRGGGGGGGGGSSSRQAAAATANESAFDLLASVLANRQVEQMRSQLLYLEPAEKKRVRAGYSWSEQDEAKLQQEIKEAGRRSVV